jgi:aspartate/methionine/tyrosine aminotransferase
MSSTLQKKPWTRSSAISTRLLKSVEFLSRPSNYVNGRQGRPRLMKAIADAYSPSFGHKIDPKTEVTITTGANEGMLSAFMAFIEPGDEVVIFEPFFDQYALASSPGPCTNFDIKE